VSPRAQLVSTFCPANYAKCKLLGLCALKRNRYIYIIVVVEGNGHSGPGLVDGKHVVDRRGRLIDGCWARFCGLMLQNVSIIIIIISLFSGANST